MTGGKTRTSTTTKSKPPKSTSSPATASASSMTTRSSRDPSEKDEVEITKVLTGSQLQRATSAELESKFEEQQSDQEIEGGNTNVDEPESPDLTQEEAIRRQQQIIESFPTFTLSTSAQSSPKPKIGSRNVSGSASSKPAHVREEWIIEGSDDDRPIQPLPHQSMLNKSQVKIKSSSSRRDLTTTGGGGGDKGVNTPGHGDSNRPRNNNDNNEQKVPLRHQSNIRQHTQQFHGQGPPSPPPPHSPSGPGSDGSGSGSDNDDRHAHSFRFSPHNNSDLFRFPSNSHSHEVLGPVLALKPKEVQNQPPIYKGESTKLANNEPYPAESFIQEFENSLISAFQVKKQESIIREENNFRSKFGRNLRTREESRKYFEEQAPPKLKYYDIYSIGAFLSPLLGGVALTAVEHWGNGSVTQAIISFGKWEKFKKKFIEQFSPNISKEILAETLRESGKMNEEESVADHYERFNKLHAAAGLPLGGYKNKYLLCLTYWNSLDSSIKNNVGSAFTDPLKTNSRNSSVDINAAYRAATTAESTLKRMKKEEEEKEQKNRLVQLEKENERLKRQTINLNNSLSKRGRISNPFSESSRFPSMSSASGVLSLESSQPHYSPNPSSSQQGNGRGRGRGSDRGGRGRGGRGGNRQGHFQSQDQGNFQSSWRPRLSFPFPDSAGCWQCNSLEHFRNDCPHKPLGKKDEEGKVKKQSGEGQSQQS